MPRLILADAKKSKSHRGGGEPPDGDKTLSPKAKAKGKAKPNPKNKGRKKAKEDE